MSSTPPVRKSLLAKAFSGVYLIAVFVWVMWDAVEGTGLVGWWMHHMGDWVGIESTKMAVLLSMGCAAVVYAGLTRAMEWSGLVPRGAFTYERQVLLRGAYAVDRDARSGARRPLQQQIEQHRQSRRWLVGFGLLMVGAVWIGYPCWLWWNQRQSAAMAPAPERVQLQTSFDRAMPALHMSLSARPDVNRAVPLTDLDGRAAIYVPLRAAQSRAGEPLQYVLQVAPGSTLLNPRGWGALDVRWIPAGLPDAAIAALQRAGEPAGSTTYLVRESVPGEGAPWAEDVRPQLWFCAALGALLLAILAPAWWINLRRQRRWERELESTAS